ncbi:MAG: hypothetical protein M0Z41_07130 [Peptococcaceae bacterium]|jgi:hypothetical protein|nr:hypothetical protein [Peptococcaceae bacterium]
MVSSRVRRAWDWLTGHLPLVLAGAFIVVALGAAAAAAAATRDPGAAPAQVPGTGVAQSAARVIYPRPPVWLGYGRPGPGEIAATGNLEIVDGRLVLSAAGKDIILTAPDGQAFGVVTAVGPWNIAGGQLTITVRELMPYPALSVAGAQGSETK